MPLYMILSSIISLTISAAAHQLINVPLHGKQSDHSSKQIADIFSNNGKYSYALITNNKKQYLLLSFIYVTLKAQKIKICTHFLNNLTTYILQNMKTCMPYQKTFYQSFNASFRNNVADCLSKLSNHDISEKIDNAIFKCILIKKNMIITATTSKAVITQYKNNPIESKKDCFTFRQQTLNNERYIAFTQDAASELYDKLSTEHIDASQLYKKLKNNPIKINPIFVGILDIHKIRDKQKLCVIA